jgi:ectoine hydroxylase-related dioxygenase (phytanoyl-CoA dioxygenase family)
MLSSVKATVRNLKDKSVFLDRSIDLLHHAKEFAYLGYGMAVNRATGHTPKSAHEALVALFTRSGGRVNDTLSSVISLYNRPYHVENESGVLRPLGDATLAKIQAELETNGYYVFEDRLPEAFCDKIAERIADAGFIVRDDALPYDPGKLHKYDRNAPFAHNYMLPPDDTTDIPEVQELVSDPALITVAQNYLKAKSIFTGISLYWSAAVKDRPDDNSAQTFHWDMERIRWIRFFICLTDVDEDSGPHCFIKGTHRTGALPKEVYSRGYVRHDDEGVIGLFGKDSYREFTGKKGTIVAEDSRGLHKGKVLKKGERLMLAFELSNSTFGADKRHTIRGMHSPRFAEFSKKYPGLYANFDF